MRYVIASVFPPCGIELMLTFTSKCKNGIAMKAGKEVASSLLLKEFCKTCSAHLYKLKDRVEILMGKKAINHDM